MNSFSIHSLRIALIAITVLLAIFGVLFPTWLSSWDFSLFILLVVLTGIPHGATDHLIFFHLRKNTGKYLFAKFIIVYLLVMLVYGLCWLLFPLASLLFFLWMSAYHFGQSQFTNLKLPENHLFKKVIYVLWGSWLLFSILLLNAEETILVLQGLFTQAEFYLSFVLPYRTEIIALLSWATVVVLLWGLQKKWMNKATFIRELLTVFVLLLLFVHTSLWISFGVYFGLWHALSSIYFEVKGLNNISFLGFFKKALPFSLISFVGIGILLGIGIWWNEKDSLVLLFFMALSTLTLPHTLYMQRFYASFN